MMIDFKDLVGDRARNISGHERGVMAREKYNLDEIDSRRDTVEIMVPEHIDAIAPSFFQGMFSKSVRQYQTKERFLEHYHFIASPVVMEQIIRGINRSMTKRDGAAFLN